ncbi:ErfK/YbiS/YcfS/YnhG family protein [Methyloglobulus morosus KoM1]|uniref:ErfK/YbiS/YcfS/YnhG family protein n=1 Tax=Methyloglobulus morosus KoM1 TaxID=1116472 RepID=V5C5S1_9GAMM|nr:L,D-transpeptidase family protein [Methyloglobulus morosus]ESS72078.1 ErfK/YbiS/YcfS/YnhG family protein [Methyloglobulus morosus KoM1]
MLIFKRLIFFIGLFAILATLSGCQTLSGLFASGKQDSGPPSAQLQSNIDKHEFELSGDQALIGEIAAVESRENDTLPDIARHFGLGYNDITAANASVSPWTPAANSRVLLPLQFILPDAPHKGIVLNVANMRMFYYPKKERNKVFTYPVGIGRDGWNTPMGMTSVAVKTPNPDWHVPPSIHREHAAKGHYLPSVVRSGPDNPLGFYAMRLAIGSYLIHGTNKPFGIGMQISHGCVQMYPEDIEVLFKKVSVGTPVRIVHDPYLTAWYGDMLYLEANEPLEKWSSSKPQLKKQVSKELRKIAKQHNATVDWGKVDKVIQRADGIPTPILVNSSDVAELSKSAVQLARPTKLYGQPETTALTDNDWAMLVATFNNENDARKLAAMLNHQGPPIPARKVQADNAYQVVAGPFKNQKQAKEAASRIRFDFEIESKLLKPLRPKEIAKN